MELGNFSVSLAVRDIDASRAFYEKLGFVPVMGDAAQGWLILRNGDTVIGLFQGMFERNTLTFNPGWDRDTNALTTFTDVRELQRQLKAQGVEFASEVDESGFRPRQLRRHRPRRQPDPRRPARLSRPLPTADLKPAAPILVGASGSLVPAVGAQEDRGGQLHGHRSLRVIRRVTQQCAT